MKGTCLELAQVLAGMVAFALLLLPSGYLVAVSLNLFGVRRRSAAEQLLWAVALSLPLSLFLTQALGRLCSPAVSNAFFLLLALAAVNTAASLRSEHRPAPPPGTALAMGAALFLLLYVALGTLNVTVGRRLFVPNIILDWSVRLPMVTAAVHGGVPPSNPLSALGAHPAPLRYYYFWYVLCAAPARLLHLPNKAVLAASAGWAALDLLAGGLLCLRYLVGLRGFSVRRVALLLLSLSVIGLDLLRPSLLNTYLVLPDLEWWREDRTPGFATTILNSPHHIVGLVSCLLAMILLVEACRGESAQPASISGIAGVSAEGTAFGTGGYLLRAVLVGVVFSACAGTSTFILFVFVSVCALWGLDLLRARQFAALGVLLGSGAVAYLLSHPYLRELSGSSSAAHGFATLQERSLDGAFGFLAAHKLLLHRPVLAWSIRQLYVLVFTMLELGYFLFVLLDRLRFELLPALRGRRQLTPGARALWIVLLAAGLNGLFVSSTVTQSANDLGMHAGMLVRFVLVLWSVPFLERFAVRELPRKLPARQGVRPAPPRPARSLRWASAVCLVLGVLGTVGNVLLQRFYLPLCEAHRLHVPDTSFTDGLSSRLFDIRSTTRWMSAHLPADARIEFNPGGTLQPAFPYFAQQQIVASDSGCGTAFGGDYNRCPPVIKDLRQLYGGFPAEEAVARRNHQIATPRPSMPSGAVDFTRVCASDGLGYVLVDAADPAWRQPGSWVWSLTPLFAQKTVRLFACPVQPKTT